MTERLIKWLSELKKEWFGELYEVKQVKTLIRYSIAVKLHTGGGYIEMKKWNRKKVRLSLYVRSLKSNIAERQKEEEKEEKTERRKAKK